MTAAAGILQRTAEESLFAWPASQIELEPDQAVFFLRKSDRMLVRVALSGTDAGTVRLEPRCEALVVNRDLGVRLRVPCAFAGAAPGEIEAEVRLRLLDNAAEWPRRLPQTAAKAPTSASSAGAEPPEEALGRLVAAVFGAEIAAFTADHAPAEFSRRLNDPELIAEAEARLRHTLGRWTEEGILSLVAIHFLAAESRPVAVPDEVRWRLFEPTDLLPAHARPPRMVKESSAPYEALISGQHLQLVVRPANASHVYVLALGPYHTEAGTEYRWMRLFGNGGRSDLVERVPRGGGNRVEQGATLLFPGDAGASELFQQYLTLDAAPGWESLIVAITPRLMPDEALDGRLPRPPSPSADFRAFQADLNRGLQSLFGTDARLYLFQFFHS